MRRVFTIRYLCRALKNPNGIARITLNYEKFLLDKDGRVLRRYPRRLEASDFEQDVKAIYDNFSSHVFFLSMIFWGGVL